MEKITKVEKIDNCLEWTWGVPLSQIKDDIEKLEKQGITHINIEISDNYGSQYISIETEIQRLETDEEFEERVNIEKAKLKIIEARELAEFERLKKKFEK
jgi:hypothetical protein